jgi:hypothetical protein
MLVQLFLHVLASCTPQILYCWCMENDLRASGLAGSAAAAGLAAASDGTGSAGAAGVVVSVGFASATNTIRSVFYFQVGRYEESDIPSVEGTAGSAAAVSVAGVASAGVGSAAVFSAFLLFFPFNSALNLALMFSKVFGAVKEISG